MPTLFDSIRIGNTELNNRIIMAPMTGSCANDAGVQPPFASEYYGQRASAGLIITRLWRQCPKPQREEVNGMQVRVMKLYRCKGHGLESAYRRPEPLCLFIRTLMETNNKRRWSFKQYAIRN